MTKPIYAPLPARAIGDEKLSALDLRVLAALAAHDRLGANGIGCYASHPRLAGLVGCHEKSLSRSLATLAGNRYIQAGHHPLNRRLRVYKVIYTDFDKTYLASPIGNEPATNGGRRKGNRTATEKPAIGNQIVPALVTEPNRVPYNNQELSSVNIFSETGIHPVETENTSGESASTGEKNVENAVPVERANGIRKRTSDASVGAMLGMLERKLKTDVQNLDLERWHEYLEQVMETTEVGDPNYGRAYRLIEEVGGRIPF
ncbi:helix-turn-helix domain-containing protein [Rhizobium mongolense]|uniref:Helix-turn-helix protein n=1 Tax=Rhizobium mongolense TaxID=57676 RepID=A0A7W6WGY1_9HYPH|nr:helix-turn-helix domain-containing protein [Rhizobium mongolense]MBB4277249.1 hypothetical protein [Rhizobium mongolense]